MSASRLEMLVVGWNLDETPLPLRSCRHASAGLAVMSRNFPLARFVRSRSSGPTHVNGHLFYRLVTGRSLPS